MIFNSDNCDRAAVYDVNSKERIVRVLMINTKTGAVLVAKQPVRLNHKGKVDHETIRFESIHPIYGGGVLPCLFHCYGRRT